ncbi:hypothetical protein Tco_0264512 [Tanacetum coccineum]
MAIKRSRQTPLRAVTMPKQTPYLGIWGRVTAGGVDGGSGGYSGGGSDEVGVAMVKVSVVVMVCVVVVAGLCHDGCDDDGLRGG